MSERSDLGRDSTDHISERGSMGENFVKDEQFVEQQGVEPDPASPEKTHDKDENIKNKGWHENKSGNFQIPIDMDNPKAKPGFGLNNNGTFCLKCLYFWSSHCGCTSKKTLKIGGVRVISRIVMAILVWGFFYALTFPSCAKRSSSSSSDDNSTELPTSPSSDEMCIIPGLPGGNIFGIVIVFLCGMTAELLIVLIPMPFGLPTLPPLLGSLLIGILLRNVPGIDVAKYINDVWSSKLRNMALGIILGRAGLEVDKQQMYKLRWVVPRLAFAPCIIEACSYGVFAHYILDLPWEWSFMLGFVCGAVAPACVVPPMIKFQEEGYGVEHGIPSLLIAAASIDDIVAINVFNILLTVTFGGESILYNVGIAVAEIVLGMVFGVVGGFFLQKVPDRRQHNVVRDRTFLLIAFSFFLIFVTDGPLDLAGAGTLGTLICSFIAAIGWKHEQSEAVAQYFKGIWFIFQPLLFGLTGATVDFSLMDAQTVGLALGCMLICLTIRLTVAGNAVSCLGWSHKEKFLTSIAWIPKATVQAAIGGSALSRVYEECGPLFDNACEGTGSNNTVGCIDKETEEYQKCSDEEMYALIILQVSVLLILITAPIGVFLIGVAGPRLLSKATDGDIDETEKQVTVIENGFEEIYANGIKMDENNLHANIKCNGGPCAGRVNTAFDTDEQTQL